MLLKSFGCSFIFGTDLSDCHSITRLRPSQLTWPALLSQELGYTYECFARPGSGNLQTTEKVLNELAGSNSALYIISWTWIDRFDYNEPFNNRWQTLMPCDQTHEAEFYYKNLHSQYRDKLTTLINIKITIDQLLAKKQPFVMTYLDELIFEEEWHASPAILELQKYIRPYMTKFDDLTFLNWAKKKGYPISDTLHPLEQAHENAVKVLYKQNTIDRLHLS